LRKRKINSSKRALSKDDRGYLTVQTRQEIKELISDFRDVLGKLRCLYYCTIGRKPIVLIHGRIIHPRGDE
jgi:hypothetical protein